ncbi:MAG: BlaI/MecI/CopY family transcriptional regulator [Rikenellaceae bacterium]
MEINTQGKELTRAELEIMQVIWDDNDEGQFLADIINKIPEPRPAYTTVSTIIRILVRKGFVTFKSYGKIHCYRATISKEEYASEVMGRVKMHFFGNSISNMISFFARREKLSESEKEELRAILDQE